MSRPRHRISRVLIAALVVVLVAGLGLYLHSLTKPKSAQSAIAVTNSTSNEANALAPPVSAEISHAAVAPSSTPVKNMQPVALVTETPAPTANRPAAITAAATAPAPATSSSPSPSADKPGTSAASTLLANASADELLRDGKAKFEAGDLLAARESLNAALQSNKLSAADVTAVKAALSDLSDTVVFSPKRFADDPFGGIYSVQSGDHLAKIATDRDVTAGLLKRINNITDEHKLRAGATIKIIKGPFFAVVDKKQFTMDLYLGGPPGDKNSVFVRTYKVGLGKDESTPTGVWLVEPHKKIINPTYYSPRGEGVTEADDPKNPLGERWIGLTGIDGHAVGQKSYGIHGTIEPDSIGKMSSMGCIRMHNEDVEVVFDLLTEGKSTVTVRE